MAPMGYKTILVHFNDQRRAERVLEPVLSLARRYGSHVIGLYVAPSVSPPPLPVPGSGQVVGMALGAQRQEARAIAAIFSRMTANQPFTAEWRNLEVPGFDPGRVAMEHARCADLIVAAQADPDRAFSQPLDMPERFGDRKRTPGAGRALCGSLPRDRTPRRHSLEADARSGTGRV
jgi:nucleotide-binding universal stress UspA family protein